MKESNLVQLKFKTKKARELSLKLLNKIKKHLSLSESLKKLEMFLPVFDVKEILKRQKYVKSALKKIELIQDVPLIQDLLSLAIKFDKNIIKRHNNIVIAFSDEDDYDKYKSQLAKLFYVTLIQTEHDLISISHYEEIRYVSGRDDLLKSSVEELEQAIIFNNNFSLDELTPELYTDLIEENEESISAIKELVDILGENISVPQLKIEKLSFQDFKNNLELIVKDLQEIIQKEIKSSQFSGEQLVSIIQNDEYLLDKISSEARIKIVNFKKNVLKNLENQFKISAQSAMTINNVGKVLIDEIELENIQKRFFSNQQKDLSEQKKSVAQEAKLFIEKIDFLLDKILELDLNIALSLFIQEFNLEFPEIVSHGQEFVFGRNMNLINPVPVEYYIGNEEKVAVITGANSGGKTTLMELLAQIQILTQMGLGVPAKNAKIGVVKEIYYFSKNKGSVNAGAFETLLKQFANISENDSEKLILADEIESVTEPDVAAKIIKGIINHSQKTKGNILVLVTHMGKELVNLNVKARFDGIEAKGLDNKFNLVVDRNPIIGRIARSTPQLIIERMAKLNKNDFYDDLYDLVTV